MRSAMGRAGSWDTATQTDGSKEGQAWDAAKGKAKNPTSTWPRQRQKATDRKQAHVQQAPQAVKTTRKKGKWRTPLDSLAPLANSLSFEGWSPAARSPLPPQSPAHSLRRMPSAPKTLKAKQEFAHAGAIASTLVKPFHGHIHCHDQPFYLYADNVLACKPSVREEAAWDCGHCGQMRPAHLQICICMSCC